MADKERTVTLQERTYEMCDQAIDPLRDYFVAYVKAIHGRPALGSLRLIQSGADDHE